MPSLKLLCTAAALLTASAALAAPAPLDAAPPVERPAASGLKLATKKIPARPGTDQAAPAASPATPDSTTTPAVPPAPATTPPSAAELSSPTKRTLADCMKLWDKDTHMSKADWKATCVRSQKEADKHEAIVARERKAMDREKAKAAK